MTFFSSAIGILQTLVIAIGAGLGAWASSSLLEWISVNDNPGAKDRRASKQAHGRGGVALIGSQLIPLLSELF